MMMYGVIINVFLQVFLSFSMHIVWGLMNTLQLISFMMKINVIVPSNLYVFFYEINDFLNMKAAFIDSWLQSLSQFMSGVDNSYDQSLLKNVAFIGSPSFILSLGTGLIIVLGAILAILVVGLLSICSKRSLLLQKLLISVKQKLFFNSIARTLVQQYFKFCMLACITLDSLSFSTQGQTVNSTIGLLMILFVTVFPVFVFIFLRKKQPVLGQEYYQLRYNSLYLNIQTEIGPSVLLTSFFLARRFTLAILIVFSISSQVAQLVYLQLSSLGMLIYLVKFRPLNAPYLNVLEIFNETTIVLCSSLMVAFSDYCPNVNSTLPLSLESEQGIMRSQVGWVIIALIALNIIATLISIILEILKTIFTKFRDMKKKQQAIAKKEPQNVQQQSVTPVNNESMSVVDPEIAAPRQSQQNTQSFKKQRKQSKPKKQKVKAIKQATKSNVIKETNPTFEKQNATQCNVVQIIEEDKIQFSDDSNDPGYISDQIQIPFEEPQPQRPTVEYFPTYEPVLRNEIKPQANPQPGTQYIPHLQEKLTTTLTATNIQEDFLTKVFHGTNIVQTSNITYDDILRLRHS